MLLNANIFALIILIFLLNLVTILGQTTEEKAVRTKLACLILTRFLDDLNGDMYLLDKNLPSDSFIDKLKGKGIKNVKVIDEPILGENIYSFESFELRRNYAKVSFAKRWTSPSKLGLLSITYDFVCKKRNGKWNCKLARFTRSQS